MWVRDYFKNKNIFITGGSGFIGKCLIEKILRSIPEIGNIYFLLRLKKGKTHEERLKTVFENEIFNELRRINNYNFLRKIIVIEGDIQQPKLGISEENWKILIENVDIIYHSAASIRFDDPLYYAVLTNVRSTRDVIELALEAKHLKAFIHISTAFCNSDKRVVEEKLYPSFGDWRAAIRLAEEGDKITTDYLTEKYIQPLTNTYVYAKSLAEHVVNDLCRGKIPAIIVRPSVVTCTSFEPIPGWTDNLNGPLGLFYAGGTGLLRSIYGDGKTVLDFVPVDGVVNVLIITAYEKMKNTNNNVIEVYNNSVYDMNNLTFQNSMDKGYEALTFSPPSEMVWYPFARITNYRLLYYIRVIIFHLLPALMIDGILKLCGKKPRLFKIQKKIYIANMVLSAFMLNTWYFKNYKTMEIEKKLNDEDFVTFGYTKSLSYPTQHMKDYIKYGGIGIQRYCLKLQIDQTKNLKAYWRFWILDIIARVLFYLFLIWFVKWTNVVCIIYQRFESYLCNL